MAGFIETVAEQTFKKHPWLFLFILLVAAGVLGHSYRVFAEQGEVDQRFQEIDQRFEAVSKRFDRLDNKIDLRALEERLHDIESEIFQLERIASSDAVTNRDLRRLDKLKLERGDVKRKIDRLLR